MANQARKIQRETGMAYMTCLSLYNGQLVINSRSEDCIIKAALAKTKFRPRERTPEAIRECDCPKCKPEADD